MIVADTSPLNYLIQIDAIHLLPALYQTILIPRSVSAELAHSNSLADVRLWANHLPAPFEVIQSLPTTYSSTVKLDQGETDVLSLALEKQITRVLMDESKGRLEARRLGLRRIGTLAVLIAAGQQNLIDPYVAYRRLLATNFRTSSALERVFMAEIADLRKHNEFRL